jgi:hypothetical protein
VLPQVPPGRGRPPMAGSTTRWPSGRCAMCPAGAGRRGGRRRHPATRGCLGLGRKGLSTDITPLVAVSPARWGHATRAHLHNREPRTEHLPVSMLRPRVSVSPGVVARTRRLGVNPVSGADGHPGVRRQGRTRPPTHEETPATLPALRTRYALAQHENERSRVEGYRDGPRAAGGTGATPMALLLAARAVCRFCCRTVGEHGPAWAIRQIAVNRAGAPSPIPRVAKTALGAPTNRPRSQRSGPWPRRRLRAPPGSWPGPSCDSSPLRGRSPARWVGRCPPAGHRPTEARHLPGRCDQQTGDQVGREAEAGEGGPRSGSRARAAGSHGGSLAAWTRSPPMQ